MANGARPGRCRYASGPLTLGSESTNNGAAVAPLLLDPPHDQCLVSRAGDECRGVPAEPNGAHRIVVTLEYREGLSAPSLPEVNCRVISTSGHGLAVRT